MYQVITWQEETETDDIELSSWLPAVWQGNHSCFLVDCSLNTGDDQVPPVKKIKCQSKFLSVIYLSTLLLPWVWSSCWSIPVSPPSLSHHCPWSGGVSWSRMLGSAPGWGRLRRCCSRDSDQGQQCRPGDLSPWLPLLSPDTTSRDHSASLLYLQHVCIRQRFICNKLNTRERQLSMTILPFHFGFMFLLGTKGIWLRTLTGLNIGDYYL